ncbi:flavin reductase [Devosia sp. Leaf64]|uniref:flavin reductase n=1 Tax=Devosia sp. Leaf64 TaxID=1736229 RepID=UPI000714E1A9|nr:flavin reductase [Devosia sp. Leaf64]KQN72363.1 hypothetical protein ASE94_07565 [Devosia sp. Leaf64]
MDVLDHRPNSVDKATYRNGMSRLGTSVNVVTTTLAEKRYGFTASAVCSVSDTPPTLLVCINRTSSCFHAFENARHFCVNTLRPGQEDLSELFGGRMPGLERFALGEWHEGFAGVPVLATASVSFDCELTSFVDEATHRVLFGRVVSVRENDEKATLMYCMRRYISG